MPGIDSLQLLDDLLQCGSFHANKAAGNKCLLQVTIAQSKIFQVKIGTAVFAFANGIGICHQMSFGTVGLDELVNRKFFGKLAGVGRNRLCRIGWHMPVAGLAADNGKIKTFEKAAEIRVNTFRVIHKILVKPFDI